MWKRLQAINKHLILAIPSAMVAGFVFGLVTDPGFLQSFIVPATFLMVYPMMVTLKIREVWGGGDIRAQVITQAMNFAVVPFLAYGLGVLFFGAQPYMALGLLLAGLVPTSGMTISWTGLAKGNLAAAVKMTVVGLTLGSLASPLYVRWLLGAAVSVDVAAVMRQIGVIVFLPMLAGYLTQRTLVRRVGSKAFQAQWAPRFPLLSTVGVLGIVFIAIALKASAIAASPALLLGLLPPLSLMYAANYTLSTIAGRLLLPRGDAIAMVYGSVMRNLSIALAIAINAFGPQGSDAALVIAVAYIIQVQSAAWFVKGTDRIFGPAPAPSPVAGTTPEAAPEPAVALPADMVPRFQKILYATDLSATARHVARYACSLGHHYGASVTVLHVVPDAVDGLSTEAGVDLARQVDEGRRHALNQASIDAARAALTDRIRKVSEHVTRQIPTCPVSQADILVRVGNPVRQIVETVRGGGYDLVVMGTHGHGVLEEAFVGSVAAGVIRACQTPVLIARIPQEGAVAEASVPSAGAGQYPDGPHRT